MFDLIANLLSFFYDINNSYVVAIVLLTLVVLLISTPLTLKGTSSMLRMQLMQPELKAIQDKYGKDEREAMNAELLEFYKENNINPVGGCLPLLFQIPIFLVLYRVILGLTRRATEVGSQLGSVAAAVGSGTDATTYESTDLNQFNPAYVNEGTQLHADLSSSNEMESIGFDLARSASQVIGESLSASFPYLLLVLVVGVTGWFQHRMIRRRQTGASINPTQEMIMKMMPFFLPIFAFTLPAAIVFYFLVSNLYRIAQQWYITRSMYTGDDSLGAQLRKQREDGDGGSGSKGKGGSGKGGSNGGKGSGGKGGGSGKGGSGGNKGGKNGSGGNKGGTKAKAKAGARTSAPGRNSSGVSASARTQVQPKARKKKKR